MLQLTDVVKNLLIINVLMFLASLAFDTNMLALYYPGSDQFQPFQLVTHFFMHGGAMHILFNMWALVMFGVVLERLWGPQRFLFFYLFCAFGAAILHMGFDFWQISQFESILADFRSNPGFESYNQFFDKVDLGNINAGARENINDLGLMLSQGDMSAVGPASSYMEQFIELKKGVPVVGASGAIYGLLLGFGMLFPEHELMLIFLPVPIKAKYFIPLLILVELFLGFGQYSWVNIAHFAHLGGALFGFLLILYWRNKGERLY